MRSTITKHSIYLLKLPYTIPSNYHEKKKSFLCTERGCYNQHTFSIWSWHWWRFPSNDVWEVFGVQHSITDSFFCLA